MTAWLVLDVDEGALGAYPTRRAAATEHAFGPVLRRHQYGEGGSYEYLTGWGDDTTSFFVEREDQARRGGWGDVLDAWIAAGRPMGRFDEPIGPAS